MQITKCDICKKNINKNEEKTNVSIMGGRFRSFEFCGKCAEPIKKMLVSKKLIEKIVKK